MWVLGSACARSRDIASYFVLPSSAVSTSHAAHCALHLRSLLCLLCPSIAFAPPIPIPITLPFLLPLRRSATSRRANHAHARSRLGAARRLAPPFRTSSSEFPARNSISQPPAPHLPSWLPSFRPSSLLASPRFSPVSSYGWFASCASRACHFSSSVPFQSTWRVLLHTRSPTCALLFSVLWHPLSAVLSPSSRRPSRVVRACAYTRLLGRFFLRSFADRLAC